MPRGKSSCMLGARAGHAFGKTGGQALRGRSFWDPPSLCGRAASLLKTG